MNEDQQLVIEALKKTIFDLGDAAAHLIEQELKCNFVDDHGHHLRMNKSFISLANALQAATTCVELKL